jgi:predicted nicotinamide N-methyase
VSEPGALAHLDLVEERLELAGISLEIARPLDAAALVSEEEFADNEFLPYWAEIWPSGLRLAAHLTPAVAELRIVELGCGLALPSLVASALGAEVLATDWSHDAIALVEENARRNGLSLATSHADWSHPDGLVARAPFDLVLGADIAYEARNVEWLLNLLPRLSDRALIADPGRTHGAELIRRLGERYLVVEHPGGIFSLER